jgi:hypothetical protein
MGADTAGSAARSAAIAAANQAATYPRSGGLLNTQGNQGTAMQPLIQGQAGTRRFLHSAGRTIAFGGVGNVGMPYTGTTPPQTTLWAGQTDNPPPVLPPGDPFHDMLL